MTRPTKHEPWLEDLSIVLKPDAIRRRSRDPGLEAFAGSKVAALLALLPVAAAAGAIGGLLVSSALWERVWPGFLAVLLLPFGAAILRRPILRGFGKAIGYLAGWCLFFGALSGAIAMLGAQLPGAGWAYGVAGAVGFFFAGITGGDLEPPGSASGEIWFLTSAICCPAAGCLAVWTYRNLLPGSDPFAAAAITGVIAALPFLAVTMALYMKVWNTLDGVKRLATLYLHHDRFTKEALALLDKAQSRSRQDATLLDRRGLAHALLGEDNAAAADWARHRKLDPVSVAPLLSRGWLHLRRERPGEAAEAFEQAVRGLNGPPLARAGLAAARLRLNDPQAAVAAIEAIPPDERDVVGWTLLAEAQLSLGHAEQAVRSAFAAIELDSAYGRAWVVRAEAYAALGNLDTAAKDFSAALSRADESGIEERAQAGLKAIRRPFEDEPE